MSDGGSSVTTELYSEEALKYVWEGAIPLQIRLHESEITTLPPPPPIHVLGSRLGYLPLLIPVIKPHFSSTLPPGEDTVWFDYKGLPLKWYMPTGVLFDLLCAEPERPWNLTVHFRGYPGEVLTPCDGEESVKWAFINSLKEAAYIINGHCKHVMSMSQADQFELWQSIVKGSMDVFRRISSRLKLGPLGEDCIVKTTTSTSQPRPSQSETNATGSTRAGRIPVRLYMRSMDEDLHDLEDAAPLDSWDSISYINRPIEIFKQHGTNLTLKSALHILLPEIFRNRTSRENQLLGTEVQHQEPNEGLADTDAIDIQQDLDEREASVSQSELEFTDKVKLIRIQGIELDLDIPLFWVVNNLMHPEFFLHVCIFVGGLWHHA